MSESPSTGRRERMSELDELEEAIEALKVAYDRYFYGVDKALPKKLHDQVDRMMRVQLGHAALNTAMRFRIGSLKSRYVTYGQYWTRVLNQIENGTYKRVLAQAERRERSRPVPQAQEAAAQASSETAAAPAPSNGAPPAPARGAAGSGPRPVASGGELPAGMDAKEARELFRSFVTAKKAAGESVEGVSYAGLLAKLSRELPALQARHGAAVSFEVATVDGKVRLRARKAPASPTP